MTLLELLQIIRKHLKLVIALPIVFALVTALVSWTMLSNTSVSYTHLTLPTILLV